MIKLFFSEDTGMIFSTQQGDKKGFQWYHPAKARRMVLAGEAQPANKQFEILQAHGFDIDAALGALETK